MLTAVLCASLVIFSLVLMLPVVSEDWFGKYISDRQLRILSVAAFVVIMVCVLLDM